MQQKLQIPGHSRRIVWQTHLCLILSFKASLCAGSWVSLISSTCSSTGLLSAVFYSYLLFETAQLLKGCRRPEALLWPRLCWRRAWCPDHRAVTSSILLLLPRLPLWARDRCCCSSRSRGPSFSSPSTVSMYCSLRVSRFAHEWRQDKKGRSRRWSFPFLAHGCKFPAQNYSISALWSYLGWPGEKESVPAPQTSLAPGILWCPSSHTQPCPRVSTLVAELWSLCTLLHR